MAKPETRPASVSAKPRQALQKHVPSGPRVQLDPNPVPKIKQVGGGNDDRWNNRVANSLVGSLSGAHSTKGIDVEFYICFRSRSQARRHNLEILIEMTLLLETVILRGEVTKTLPIYSWFKPPP
jgi:hypothetical protein